MFIQNHNREVKQKIYSIIISASAIHNSAIDFVSVMTKTLDVEGMMKRGNGATPVAAATGGGGGRKSVSVNGAFAHLRDLIPTEPLDRKLSKIETLRLATSYIEHLSSQLNHGKERSAIISCLVVKVPYKVLRQILKKLH